MPLFCAALCWQPFPAMQLPKCVLQCNCLSALHNLRVEHAEKSSDYAHSA